MSDQREILPPPAARPVRVRTSFARARGSVETLAADGYQRLLVVLIAGFAAGLLALLPHLFMGGGWLALVAGREVARHGIPAHETLTVYAHGRAWIDEQWLSQLLMYWIDRVGGIALVGVVNVALIAGTLAGGVVASTRLGASPRSVVRVLPLAAICVVLGSTVQTQPYAYPLFAAAVYLLARDSRRPSRNVFWCLPLLVLWGNLHGSASLGAGLVALRGLTVLWECRRELASRTAVWARAGALIVVPPLCLMITPYGLSMVSYYRTTLLNPAFRTFLSEWAPVTSSAGATVLVFGLAAITVWSFARHPRQTTLWERCAMLVLTAGAIVAVRNVVWFGFGTLIVLSLSIRDAIRSRARPSKSRPAMNLAAIGGVTLLLALVLGRTLASSTASLEPSYPEAALVAVRAEIADPSVRVFADERFADWLLWELPGVRGRVAYDVSYELLTPAQLRRIFFRLKRVSGPNWKQAARGYRLLVLASSATPHLVSAFGRESRARVLYRRDGVVVILRGAAQASA